MPELRSQTSIDNDNSGAAVGYESQEFSVTGPSWLNKTAVSKSHSQRSIPNSGAVLTYESQEFSAAGPSWLDKTAAPKLHSQPSIANSGSGTVTLNVTLNAKGANCDGTMGDGATAQGLAGTGTSLRSKRKQQNNTLLRTVEPAKTRKKNNPIVVIDLTEDQDDEEAGARKKARRRSRRAQRVVASPPALPADGGWTLRGYRSESERVARQLHASIEQSVFGNSEQQQKTDQERTCLKWRSIARKKAHNDVEYARLCDYYGVGHI